MSNDRPNEQCGVFGIFAPGEDVAQLTLFGLQSLQHRGQEAAGIAVADGRQIQVCSGIGLVSQVFSESDIESLQGNYAIGHTRYSTTGSSSIRNTQPYLIETQFGPLAVAHNGNLVNAAELRKLLLKRGVGLTSSSDTEVLTMMLAGAEGDSWEERIVDTMPLWRGAYSLVILSHDCVYAVRDPWGFRPLSVGRLPNGSHVVASETGALMTLGVEVVREVKPGEIVSLSDTALRVWQAMPPMAERSLCTFEHIYFSRPDSIWNDLSVCQVRQRLGEEIALEAPVEADIVIPVPETSRPAAIGYSLKSGVPIGEGFVKNSYIGRTFIQPSPHLRQLGVSLKFNTLPDNIVDRKVLVIDDSIVRGTTAERLIQMLRNDGAKEVHFRITCPPIRYPCFMGVDMGTHEELIAHRMNVEEIREHIGADTLHFLSLEGMMRAIDRPNGYCNACFTGVYPIEVESCHTKAAFEETFV